MGGTGLGAVRAVPYPSDLGEIARSLSTEPAWFWLDGDAAEDSRMSYLGVASEVVEARRGREHEFLRLLAPAAPAERATGASGFAGGWVAALSYEFGVSLLGLDPAPDDASPAFALRVSTVLAVDHARGTAELRGEGAAALDEWIARFGSGVSSESRADAGRPGRSGTGVRSSPVGGARVGSPVWRRTSAAYRADVEACLAAIAAGDAYVLCLTDTAEADGAFEPLELYRELRASGGAVRGGVIVAAGRALVSASPERFIEVRGDRVATRPIKGTRRRDPDPVGDRELAAELARDPKERAENLMIVDLMRNDLSRVCRPGSVGVEGFLRVETHAHVHQLVSTVRGRLAPGSGIAEVLRSCFPGGSMTGAPKRRAVELLAGLERGPRGLYSGCFGWIGDEGDAELAMTIRSVELRGGSGESGSGPTRFATARVGAGGGITADSDPAHEDAEKELKAVPLIRALGAVSW
ncbi:anthranilate synthase component I family protein [Leucobacter sp. HNU]|uniref:anthranilate synthase component I family protein n=1 Tax=Leucobacter sp. HNU TaxID=3236805 RepID=UPI003A7FDCCD